VGRSTNYYVEAQPTQGDSDTNVVNSTSKKNSQFQGLNGSNQTDCEHLEYISRTKRSMMQNVLPPVTSMIYEGEQYDGELSEANYREGETISQLQPPHINTIANLSSNIIKLSKDSCVQFVITGAPRTLPPDGSPVSAYTIDNTPVAVLDVAENYASTFRTR
jgi:hypothetical protein